MRLRVVVNVLFLLFGIGIYAQNGMISGVIRDNASDTTLYRAKVFIKGTALGAYSDMRGKYAIKNVPAGTHNITVVFVPKGYNKTIENIVVKAGETISQNIELGQSAVKAQVKTLDLSDFVEKGSEEAAMVEVMESEQVASIVTSEENSKKGISTVGGAVKTVSGVSVQGGKYANIRGLSGRYNKTILNGSEIPGLDPDKNAVQLDLFPTSFLSSIKVIKSFTPDLPGDFSGGLIDIRTKDSPDSLTIKAGLGFSYNNQVHGNSNFLTYQGGKTDFLGFDDGTRALPTSVQSALAGNGMPTKTDVLISPEMRNYSTALGKDFNPLMAPTRNSETSSQSAPINQSLYFTIGNQIKLKDSLSTKKLGYFIGLNYRRKYEFYENGEVGRYSLPGNIYDAPKLLAERQFQKSQSKDNVLFGALATLNYKYSANSKLKFNYIHNHSGSKRSSFSEGTDINMPDSKFRVSEIDYIQRAINTLQIMGDHTIGKSKLFNRPAKFDWLTSGTISSQEQPDYRIFSDDIATLSDGSQNPQLSPAVYTMPTRFHRSMSEVNTDIKANYQITVKDTDSTHQKVKFGFSNTLKSRRFEETRMEYDGNQTNYNGNPNEYTGTDNIGRQPDGSAGVLIFDVSQTQNNYTGFRSVTGAYAMTDFSLSSKLDFIGGARYEHTLMTVESDKKELPVGEIQEHDILPSAAFIYSLIDNKKVTSKRDSNEVNNQNMKVRMSYNRTIARPSFREIAPYFVEDFIRKLTLLGNPDLELSNINNIDARWEFFPRTNEMLAVSSFYKHFEKPIGLFSNPGAGNSEFQWKNLEYSTVFGVEFEFKKRLDAIASSLDNFTFGFNLTLVKSITPVNQDELEKMRATDVHRPDTRPMAGQSPYLVNSSLEYEIKEAGLNAMITYNIFGDRLTIYSSDGRPDIYERARPELNLNLSKKVGDKLSLKFRVKNILNPVFQQEYVYKGQEEVYQKFEDQDAIFSSYRKGTSFSFGATYLF